MSIQEAMAPAPKHLPFVEAGRRSGKAGKISEPPPFAKEAYEQHIAMVLADLHKLEGVVKAKQLELGRYLRVAKANMKGEFEDWVEGKFKKTYKLSRRTAFYYISMADAVDVAPNAIGLNLQDASKLASKNTPIATKQAAKKALDEGDMQKASEILGEFKAKNELPKVEVPDDLAMNLGLAARTENAQKAVEMLADALPDLLVFFDAYDKAGLHAFDATLRQLVGLGPSAILTA